MKLNLPTAEKIRQMEASFTPGYAKFVVKKTEESISKNSGNQQIKLTLSVTDSEDTNRTIYGYTGEIK